MYKIYYADGQVKVSVETALAQEMMHVGICCGFVSQVRSEELLQLMEEGCGASAVVDYGREIRRLNRLSQMCMKEACKCNENPT